MTQLMTILALACLCAFCCLGVLSVPTDNKPIQDEQKTSDDNEVNSIFNCKRYQQLFGKKYSSHDETMSRCVQLLATALDVFTSGVAYKFRKENYYLAVNEFSDWSSQELDMMRNKASSEGETVVVDQHHEQSEPKEVDKVDLVEVVNKLQAEITRVLEQTHLKESLVDTNKGRKKRDAPYLNGHHDGQQFVPRHISMDMLIKSGDRAPKQTESNKKVVLRPPGNNGNYDALSIELITRGLVDEQELVYPWIYSPVDTILSTVEEHLSNLNNLVKSLNPFNVQSQSQSVSNEDVIASDQLIELPNEVFVDLRKTDCFFPPRHQGKCGSCYAFASMAVMEYLFCKEEGFLTPFSEQYMVDCGNSLVNGIDGCDGAEHSSVGKFIHNYGLELRHNYMYTAKVKECPYSNETKRETTGYIRYEKAVTLYVSVKYWPELLENGVPLYVRYSVQNNFHSYAGGVYDGQGCSLDGHAMVLVGHGREDGQEYWLLRNSFGTTWGEEGYFKLAKSAPEACIKGQYGLVFGTTDGKNFAELKKNNLNRDAMFKLLILKRKKEAEELLHQSKQR